MDLVVRRQSERTNRRHFSESMDDNASDKPNNDKFREIYDYRRWEWGNLRVFTLIVSSIFMRFIQCKHSHAFRRNAKIWALKHFIERMCSAYSAVICRYFL